MEPALAVDVQRRRTAGDHPEDGIRELRATELWERLAEQVDDRSLAEAMAHGEPVILDQTEHADHGRRPDRRVAGLVVEAHVAAGDGRLERTARVRIPRIDSVNCHMTSGRSGLPKFRQFVIASGVAPVQATFRAASATACAAPR